MREVLAEQPNLTPLEALMQAQHQVLPEERRRSVTTWATVRDAVAPYLGAAQQMEAPSPLPAPAPGSHAGEPHPAEPHPVESRADAATEEPSLIAESDNGPAAASAALPSVASARSSKPADLQPLDAVCAAQPELPGIPQAPGARSAPGRRSPGNTVSPAALEAALLAALDSPVVMARLSALAEQALTDALTAALAKANAVGALNGGTSAAANFATVSSRPKVLVVGLTAEQGQALATQTRQAVELRFWRPGETREQLQSVARSCQLIILMSEAVDSDVDAFLESLPVKLLRHGGSVARLRDRLVEMGEHGVD